MVNGYKIIDTHAHIYPGKIAERAVGNTDNFYGTESARLGTAEDLLLQGEAIGIDQHVVCSVATTPHQVQSINRFIAGEVEKHPDKLIGLGTMYPHSDSIEEDFKHLVSLGLLGVKLHPDIQKIAVDDPGCYMIYDMCREYGLPLLLHTGDNRYDFSNPNRLVKIIEKYPDVKFIGAHFGGWSIWERAVEDYSRFDNFMVDCSSSFNYISREAACRIIEQYGVDKVMFGTDYPMWAAKGEIDFFFSLGLKKEDNEKILHLNAEKFYYPLMKTKR